MTKPVSMLLSDGHPWLRVADQTWNDPLDPTFAQRHGGRWNPPRSYATLYLNEDVETAKAQIHQMLEGSPVRPEDIDHGYVLITATLPARQEVADGVTNRGIGALGLPTTYPLDASGHVVTHDVCQSIGEVIREHGLRGINARSAAIRDGSGRELAWFPARPSSRAKPIGDPIPFTEWW